MSNIKFVDPGANDCLPIESINKAKGIVRQRSDTSRDQNGCVPKKRRKVENTCPRDDKNVPTDQMMEPIQILSDNDVLSGRGNGANLHPGNVYFRKVIEGKKEMYSRSCRKEKQKIVRGVIEQIKSDTGRFLSKLNENGSRSVQNATEVEKKVQQALREQPRNKDPTDGEISQNQLVDQASAAAMGTDDNHLLEEISTASTENSVGTSMSEFKVGELGTSDCLQIEPIVKGKRVRQRSYTRRDQNGSVPKTRRKMENTCLKDDKNVTDFLKKTYDMISTCDPLLAHWSPDGEMIVVKDPKRFSLEVLPIYFKSNKYPSFARQLNFYEFQNVQINPLRNEDVDKNTANHLIYYNKNFKRDKRELLSKIKRTTNNRDNSSTDEKMFQNLQGEIESYKGEVAKLTNKVSFLEEKYSEMEKKFLIFES